MGTPNWKKVNPQAIANECSPRHVQSVIEDARRDIALLCHALEEVLEDAHEDAYPNARALLARIDGGMTMDDESIFTRRPKPPKWLVEEANRQWDNIPDSPADIAAWAKGAPINPVKPQ